MDYCYILLLAIATELGENRDGEDITSVLVGIQTLFYLSLGKKMGFLSEKKTIKFFVNDIIDAFNDAHR